MPRFFRFCLALFSLWMAGCPKRVPAAPKPNPWSGGPGCVETVPAITDGFQHFVCIEPRGKRWEVLTRAEPKR